MMPGKIKKVADYLPFTALVIYTVYQWLSYYKIDTVIKWQSYFGIFLLIAISILFIKKHQLAVLLTGFTCLCGITGIVSLSPAIIHSSFGFKALQISISIGDPVFLLLFVFQLILSFEWYVGILTKKYWLRLLYKNNLHE